MRRMYRICNSLVAGRQVCVARRQSGHPGKHLHRGRSCRQRHCSGACPCLCVACAWPCGLLKPWRACGSCHVRLCAARSRRQLWQRWFAGRKWVNACAYDSEMPQLGTLLMLCRPLSLAGHTLEPARQQKAHPQANPSWSLLLQFQNWPCYISAKLILALAYLSAAYLSATYLMR